MGIIQWMKRRTGPGAQDIDTADSAAEFINAHNITVIGFFDVCFSLMYHVISIHFCTTLFCHALFCSFSAESGKRGSQGAEGSCF